MLPRLAWVLLLLDATACALIRPPPRPSRYDVGDYVVYRYTGLFTPTPVTLREQVIAKKGNKLTIDDVATRGTEKRHWIQVVTDTPENQKNNVVDELYEVVDGKRHRLKNVKNTDLLRLYSWTYILPDGDAGEVDDSQVSLGIAGKSYRCAEQTGLVGWHSRTLRFRTDECPDFLWTHGRTRYWDDQFGDDILTAQVVEAGNVGSAPADQETAK